MPIVTPILFLRARKQCRWSRTQGLCQLSQNLNAGISLPPLHTAQVAEVDLSESGEEAHPLTAQPHIGPDDLLEALHPKTRA